MVIRVKIGLKEKRKNRGEGAKGETFRRNDPKKNGRGVKPQE